MRTKLRNLVRHFPPVARRDRKIARQRKLIQRLEEENRKLKQRITALEGRAIDLAQRATYANFGTMLIHHRRLIGRASRARAHASEPLLQIPFKLRNIALAKSHGISVTSVYKVWDTIAEIDLDPLPDEFVLKADGGASGHAVFPLRRAHGGYERLGSGELITAEGLRQRLTALGGRARPPYFAEELLRPTGGPVPDDVKVYTFYGRPAQVLLMRVLDPTRRYATTTRKYIDPFDGSSLGQVISGEIDPAVPAPRHLERIVEAASHLSRATGTSFCRVDFYDTPDGPVFGEITSAPGGPQRYTYDHDAGMGDVWLEAEVRLRTDILAGRPPGTLWGKHPYEWHYRSNHRTSAWERPTAPCGQWCYEDVGPTQAI